MKDEDSVLLGRPDEELSKDERRQKLEEIREEYHGIRSDGIHERERRQRRS